MKQICLLLLILLPSFVFSQKDSLKTAKTKPSAKNFYIGIKAGMNFSNVTNASSLGATGQTGYHAGILMDMGGGLMGFRLEVLYSQQGYGIATDSSSGTFTNGYISMSELATFNITRFVQLQIGGQTGYMVTAKSTTNGQSTGNATADQILSYYNRFDYGFGGGIEVHPIAGLLVGIRYNLSLSNLYNSSFYNTQVGSYSPNINFKNNVVQISVGYRF
jgi:Outer membrane protein beta-barrel domain